MIENLPLGYRKLIGMIQQDQMQQMIVNRYGPEEYHTPQLLNILSLNCTFKNYATTGRQKVSGTEVLHTKNLLRHNVFGIKERFQTPRNSEFRATAPVDS